MERRHHRGEDASEGLALRPRRATPAAPVTGVWISHGYATTPVASVAGEDLAALDLALRRAAYATERGLSARIFHDADIRIPTRMGLHVREARAGSLEWLLDIPTWMVLGLSSAPAVALINLVTIVSWREAVRIQLTRMVLSAEERLILEEAARPAPPSAALSEVGGSERPRALYRGVEHASATKEPDPGVLPRQGALPEAVGQELDASEPLVDIDVGDAHVRGVRPETRVVIQQDGHVTAVTIRALKR
jgi:hypothetical protein